MRMIWIAVIVFSVLFSYTCASVYAHPGNTDSVGCHTCHTNCDSWGLNYGQYHCHTPKYTIPTIAPLCPLFSYRDSLSGQCKCMSGYYASGDRCVSYDDSCKSQLGYSSRYNSLTGKCECFAGNIIDPSTNKCTSVVTYCSLNFGLGAQWDYVKEQCVCMSGYVWGKNGKCISKNDACHDQLGIMSSYSFLDDSCICTAGYVIKNGTCQPQEVKVNNFFIKPKVASTTPSYTTPTSVPGIDRSTTDSKVGSDYVFPFRLRSLLKEKDSNESVKILQSALRLDKELYPEGVVSGYYGKLTKKAVERFQLKYNLPNSGMVDMATFEKFNQVFGDVPKANEVSNDKSSLFKSFLNSIKSLFKK